MTTLTQITVPFHNAELYLVEHDGQPYTPMKPIVEGMGLAWQSQLAKLNANPQRWGITKIVIPTLGDLQEMVCLPLRKLLAWLTTISPNKVKPELRDTVIMYQNECDDVLW
ncbi:phage antirepressor N-terminal domain-containing protein, partial [Acinetobacter baumannii]